jgi:hypothetical protein
LLIILALGRLRQMDRQFKASLDYIARPCLKKLRGQSQVWWYTPVISALGRLRQE